MSRACYNIVVYTWVTGGIISNNSYSMRSNHLDNLHTALYIPQTTLLVL